MRKVLVAFVALALIAALPAFAAAPKPKMSKPSISSGGAGDTNIFITFAAGSPTGAPAGFSLQWMTLDDFNGLYGGAWPANSDTAFGLCKASFSGNASGYAYNLAAGTSIQVEVGDFLFDNGGSTNCAQPLACGTTYVFRAFSHADNTRQRSDFSATITVSTSPCEPTGGCTYTQGYWKTHGPIPTGNNTDVWPVASLTLGNVSYTDLELQAIFDKPAQGNGLVSLAHQLIAAKLNIASGADGTSIASTIAAADALIGNAVVPPVGTSSMSAASTSALTSALDDFNNGLTGPGHCQ
ncbi:MAG TPA: hypothetical protein VLA96_14365 [Terriglobales bacterium]|jgi:hypothetical protein|nr:hypothetical protein [Terriglobales bacterium]